jgi:hypothetical protein
VDLSVQHEAVLVLGLGVPDIDLNKQTSASAKHV